MRMFTHKSPYIFWGGGHIQYMGVALNVWVWGVVFMLGFGVGIVLGRGLQAECCVEVKI